MWMWAAPDLPSHEGITESDAATNQATDPPMVAELRWPIIVHVSHPRRVGIPWLNLGGAVLVWMWAVFDPPSPERTAASENGCAHGDHVSARTGDSNP